MNTQIASVDCHCIKLDLGALWSVESEFGRESHRVHWLALALAFTAKKTSCPICELHQMS